MKYILQKELPDVAQGAELIWNESTQKYHLYGNVQFNSFHKSIVEMKPDWFRPVKDKLDEIVETVYVEYRAIPTLGDSKRRAKLIATRHLNSELEEIIVRLEKEKIHGLEERLYETRNNNLSFAISIIKSHIR